MARRRLPVTDLRSNSTTISPVSASAATGLVLLDATAGSDAGIDVVSSEYATVAAEQSAQERLAQVIADQMVSRIALFMRNTKQ